MRLHQDVKYAVPPNLCLPRQTPLKGSNVATVADYARELISPTSPAPLTSYLQSMPIRAHTARALSENEKRSTPLDHCVLYYTTLYH